MNELRGNIVSNNIIFSGRIIFDDFIKEIIFEKDFDYTNYIIPGFVDLHCHGGKGFDSMQGVEAMNYLADFHLLNGTTTLFPTTVTANLTDTINSVKGLNRFLEFNKKKTNIDGIHLEGPFLNANKLGAQPPITQHPSFDFIKPLLAEAPIKIVTLAPELEGSLELIKLLKRTGIKPQIGHSLADYDCCVSAIEQGVESFTHLFNAMSGLDHRNPGAVAAAFKNLKFSEIICDLIHVDQIMIQLAYKNIKYLYAITDSISASGMPDGEYKLGSNTVFKKNNSVNLKEGTLGGSLLTMDMVFKNLIDIGFSIQEAVQITSTNASNYLARNDIGKISIGSRSNLLVLDHDHVLKQVYLNGALVK